MSTGLLILGLVLFVGLVILHELGHFIVARRNGVKVEEFGIGFPPTIWSKRMPSGFLFSINLLPFGGFVRLLGESDSDKTEGGFGRAKLWVKVKIMLAGIAMNLAVAVLLFTLLAYVGMPQIIEDQFNVKSNTKVIQEQQNKDVVLVHEIVEGSPADTAGILKNDQILSINSLPVTSTELLAKLTKENAGQNVTIAVKRNGETKNLTATLNKDDSGGKGYLGVFPVSGATGVELRRSTWSAPIVAIGLTKQLLQLNYSGLLNVFSSLVKGDAKQAGQQVSGPVGVFEVLKQGTNLGINFILMIIALISLTLAMFNFLPIPALDGGRLFITLFFRMLKKPLTQKTEAWIHGTGFAFLMLLLLLVTISDIGRL